MRLNHIDLYSASPGETAAFFLNALGLRLVAIRGKDAFFHMEDDSGLILIVSPPSPAHGGQDQVTLGAQTFHIGFLLADPAEVDRVRSRVELAGYDISVPRNQHGAYACYATIPGNILVEFGHRPPLD